MPVLLVLAVVVGVVHELETSALQARFFSDYAARVSFKVEPGASAHVAFPASGPFDQRRGYTAIPTFVERLQARGFEVAQQARVSPELDRLLAWGISPPYSEPADVGLIIRNPDGGTLLGADAARDAFARFEDIPTLIVAALVFMENRELLAPADVRRNPVLEWDRLARAGAVYAGSKLGLHLDRQGGSTLAIQLEKYRHSPQGRTRSAAEKLRQIVAASLKAYRDGADTRPHRQQVVVDYLNTMPLAAAPGYGEVYGLGEGLRAWFGLSLEEIAAALRAPQPSPEQASAFKHVLALIAAVRAPTHYLLADRSALEQRIDHFTHLMAQEGIIDASLAVSLSDVELGFLAHSVWQPASSFVEKKALNAVRHELMSLLGIDNAYDLGRLHLRADTTIDAELQGEITQLLQRLADPQFVRANGLHGERLLRSGDPTRVRYSFVLYERTPSGNVERVHADNINEPFDINDGIKMELGSTAKLRTLAHYLEIVAELRRDLGGLSPAQLAARASAVSDPLTKWVATALSQNPNLTLAELLDMALERSYSASPYEAFFTGGGLHSFANFQRSDNDGKRTVRVALQQSTNMVFIRLMRDLVRFHQARLPYDAAAVLKATRDPTRRQLLAEIADQEGQAVLRRSFKRYERLSPDEIVARLLGRKATSKRSLAVLFFAWRIGSTEDDLGAWLTRHLGSTSEGEVRRLYKAYSNPRLVLADYGYLLSLHPLDLWCAGELMRDPQTSMAGILERSAAVRETTSSWLFRSRNRHAQDVRLRTRIEADAFARMTPYWRALGFPFGSLVPSLATAIGSSADRPIALADLLGVIVNDGVRRPLLRLARLDFATATPYETTVVPDPVAGQRVMDPEVAAALRATLAGVVEAGTARRLRGAFADHDGHLIVAGGKTGSGDNRFETFRRGGGVISSRPINRTATFVYYIGERYFGAVTAHVPGRIASEYEFTSALPVSVLKLSAPILNARLS